ncbi:MAG: PKD domain-containing protein, partial [Thermoplasmata archaeon]|nr:PKD domain-containing protein [Thermoplasmata archaeon]
MTPPEHPREPSPGTERATHKPSVFADRKKRGRLLAQIRATSMLSIVLLVLTVAPSFAAAQGPTGKGTPVIWGLHPSHYNLEAGQPVTFFGNVTYGMPGSNSGSPVPGYTTSGYHVFWFLGNYANASNAGINYVNQSYKAPYSCRSYSTLCDPSLPGSRMPINVTTTYSVPGSYNVTVTVYDANQNWSIASTNVTVYAPQYSLSIIAPCAGATSWSSAVCSRNGTTTLVEGYPVWFQANIEQGSTVMGQTGAHFQWSFGDGVVLWTYGGQAGGNTTHHAFSTAGIYTVTLVVQNFSSTPILKAFLKVQIGNAPPPTCSHIPNAVVDSGFLMPGIGDSYSGENVNLSTSWNYGDGSTGQVLGSTNASHYYSSFGPEYATSSTLDRLGRTATCSNVETNVTAPFTQTRAKYGVVAPVGQVTFVNASNVTDIPAGDAMANYSWGHDVHCLICNDAEQSYGQMGRFQFFGQGSNETIDLNTTLPATSRSSTAYAHLKDVRPTTSVDSVYVLANVTVHLHFTGILWYAWDAWWANLTSETLSNS